MEQNLYIETYGCQMNFADSQILVSLLSQRYTQIDDYKEANLILINTCSIRDHAEQRVLNRLKEFASLKKKRSNVKIGIVGCMAERLKDELLEKNIGVDLVVGPDSYRNILNLIDQVEEGEKGIDVLLSSYETYHDIIPNRSTENGVSTFVPIMRGCENFCAYCVVPYTRGEERSRPSLSIVEEAKKLFENGYREITLLGQNVNSYKYEDYDFPKLMEEVAKIDPLLRIRFATSHPKDLSPKLVETIAKYPNICKSIHLPIQSGSDNMLKKMKRSYSLEQYLKKVENIKSILPEASLSTDIIAGFCGETEDDHRATMAVMKEVMYDSAFMFKYSDRPGTFAHKNYIDDISEEVKTRRLNEIIALQTEISLEKNKAFVGKTVEILIEGSSEKRGKQFLGRNTQNKLVVFDAPSNPILCESLKPGTYLNIAIESCSSATLIGRL